MLDIPRGLTSTGRLRQIEGAGRRELIERRYPLLLIGCAIRGPVRRYPAICFFQSHQVFTSLQHQQKQSIMPKRKHPDRSESPTAAAPPSKKKPHPQKQELDRPSVNELKKQIRNARRLLARDDLPADSRIIQERALAGFEKELEEETRRRQRSEMIGRYHFVRFLGAHAFHWICLSVRDEAN